MHSTGRVPRLSQVIISHGPDARATTFVPCISLSSSSNNRSCRRQYRIHPYSRVLGTSCVRAGVFSSRDLPTTTHHRAPSHPKATAATTGRYLSHVAAPTLQTPDSTSIRFTRQLPSLHVSRLIRRIVLSPFSSLAPAFNCLIRSIDANNNITLVLPLDWLGRAHRDRLDHPPLLTA